MSNLLDKVREMAMVDSRETFSEASFAEVAGEDIVKKLTKANLLSRRFLFAESDSFLSVNCDFNELLTFCDAIIDLSWERMNTGHWKQVRVEWRLAYAYSSLFKVWTLVGYNRFNCDLKQALTLCDMALIMSPPILDNIHARIATELHTAYRATHPTTETEPSVIFSPPAKRFKLDLPELNQEKLVKTIPSPSMRYFRHDFLDTKTPVIIEGFTQWQSMGWSAMDKTSSRKWSVDYLLQTAGERTVPVEIGSKYTDNKFSQKLMTIREFVDRFILSKSEGIGYLAQYELFRQIPELRRDFSLPRFCYVHICDRDKVVDANKDVDINCWFGPAGTVSPLHTDPKDNILVQVFGSKYIRLYDVSTPEEVIYPHKDRLLNNTSEVDCENVDKVRHANFIEHGDKYMSEFILKEGQMLFIPSGTWHFVKSLSTSCSISFWWTGKSD